MGASAAEVLYRRLIRETLFPIVLMFLTVNCAVTIPYIVVHKNSNLSAIDKEGKSRTEMRDSVA